MFAYNQSFLKMSKYFDENNTKIFIFTFISNRDSLDWKNYGAEAMIKQVCEHKHLGNGSIILMHNGAEYTAEALPAIIEGLQAKGYTLVPISELIHKENYKMDHEGRQYVE